MFHECVANDEVFEVEEGVVDVLDGPGLGIEIDGDAVREHADENVNWSTPVWRYDDGGSPW